MESISAYPQHSRRPTKISLEEPKLRSQRQQKEAPPSNPPLEKKEIKSRDNLELDKEGITESTDILVIQLCKSTNWAAQGEFISKLRCKELRMVNCPLNQSFCAALGKSDSIERLSLQNCGIRHTQQQEPVKCLDGIVEMKQLVSLELISNTDDSQLVHKYEYPEQCLELVVNKLRNLKSLHMRLPMIDRFEMWNQQITPERMELIALNIPCVTELNVGKNLLGIKGTEHIARNLRRLKMLCIWENDIGDAGVEIIADYLRDLNYLYLWGNGITNEGIKRVATLQSLEGLYIQNYTFQDDTKKYLKSKLPKICKIYFN